MFSKLAYKNKISGIYIIITCLSSNKHYIGRSVNCNERLSKHKSLLIDGKHPNSYMQNSWNKYNGDFIFDIIDNYNVATLPSMENWWCNMLNTHSKKFGFNIEPTSPYGKIRLSKETIEKIRISNTGKKVNDKTKQKLRIINTGKVCSVETISKLQNTDLCTKIDFYDKLGNFIQTFKSIREAERITNINVKSIRLCINGKFNIVKSHIFKNHGEYLSKEEITKRNSKSHESVKVKILGYYLDGIKIGEFNSYYEASKFTNLDPYKISLCCRGLQKRVKNTYWLAVQ